MAICVAHKIPYSLQPLHKNSIIFDETEKERAKQVLLKYNEPLIPNKPLGHGDVQGLVSFFYSTPNNTLPIFWSSNNGWYPLFPRGGSKSNPDNLILLPDFLQEKKIFSLDFNYSEVITRALASCFLTIDNMVIMSKVFRRLKIADDLLLAILDATDRYQRLRHEKKFDMYVNFYCG